MGKTFDEFAKPFIDEIDSIPEESGVNALAKVIQAKSVETILKILKAYHEEFILPKEAD